MRLDFACGHSATADDGVDVTPECPQCQNRQVTHVAVRPPRFAGACRGPCAQFDPTLNAVAVDLAPGGKLRLKERHD